MLDVHVSAYVTQKHACWFDFHSTGLRTCVCVCVSFVNEMFFRPVDDTGPVWESFLPLFLSSPTSSLAYISSINPILGGLLWSLCVLWAMVIICLLRSRCFMRLVCSSPGFVLLSLFLSLIQTLSRSLSLPLPFPGVLHPCPLPHSPPHFPYYSTILLFTHLSFCFVHFLSLAPCYLSFRSWAFTATQMQAQQFNL